MLIFVCFNFKYGVNDTNTLCAVLLDSITMRSEICNKIQTQWCVEIHLFIASVLPFHFFIHLDLMFVLLIVSNILIIWIKLNKIIQLEELFIIKSNTICSSQQNNTVLEFLIVWTTSFLYKIKWICNEVIIWFLHIFSTLMKSPRTAILLTRLNNLSRTQSLATLPAKNPYSLLGASEQEHVLRS